MEKGKKFKIYYFLIESNQKIDTDIEIGNIAYLYNLDHIEYENRSENSQILNEIKKIKQVENTININTRTFLLAI